MSLQTCESRENNLAEQQNLCLMKHGLKQEVGKKKIKKIYKSANNMIWMFMKILIKKSK